MRISGITNLTIDSLHIDTDNASYVTVVGKGNKTRQVPITNKTVLHLRKYLKEFDNKKAYPLFFIIRSGVPQKFQLMLSIKL